MTRHLSSSKRPLLILRGKSTTQSLAGLTGRRASEIIEHERASVDGEIDNLVYEVYGITDEERKIMEGSG